MKGTHHGIPLQARSISRSVHERLCEKCSLRSQPPSRGRRPGDGAPSGYTCLYNKKPHFGHVLAVFERACDLVTSDGYVVALVVPEIGDGPLNVVVKGLDQSQRNASSRWVKFGIFATLEPGMRADLEGRRLRVGHLEIALDQVQVWEPCPDWGRLRAHLDAIVDELPALRSLALRHAPEKSLLALAGPRPATKVEAATFATAREAAGALRAGWVQGDAAQLRAGATRLAGLGGGLTPAGDDFLAGVMLWAWLTHPTPQPLCRIMLEAAAPRTTTLSAAFLRAAARGECNDAWHHLLAALESSTQDRLAPAVQDVLSHGSTSEADTLAGFLWASTTDP